MPPLSSRLPPHSATPPSSAPPPSTQPPLPSTLTIPCPSPPPTAPAQPASHSPLRPRPSLAQPLRPASTKAYHNAQAEKMAIRSLKEQQQEMEHMVRRTVTLVIYHSAGDPPVVIDQYVATWPQFQLKALPDIMNDFDLLPTTPLDIFEDEWRVITPTTPIPVVRGQRIIIRKRQSYSRGMLDGECPGLSEEMSKWRGGGTVKLKRPAPDPPVARLEKIPQMSELHVSAVDSRLPSPSPPPSTTPNTTRNTHRLPSPSPPPSTTPNTTRNTHIRAPQPHPSVPACTNPSYTTVQPFMHPPKFPDHYYVCDVELGLREMKRLKQLNIPEKRGFTMVFGAPYVKGTIDKYLNKFWKLSKYDRMKKEYIGYGRVEKACFLSFYEVCTGKAVRRARPQHSRKPSGTDLQSTDSESEEGEDELDELDDDQPALGSRLCPFCDKPLPDAPSAQLEKMLSDLKKVTCPDPLPGFPDHRKASSFQVYIAFCQRHNFERELIPKAKSGGWPTNIDFPRVPERLNQMREALEEIMADPEESEFLEIARKGRKPGTSSTKGYSTFDQQGCGYYGERGFQIITQCLEKMFPEGDASIDLSLFSPLTWHEVIEEILVPEAAIMLIKEDLNVLDEDAVVILRESRRFGNLMHPIEIKEEEEDIPTAKPSRASLKAAQSISDVVDLTLDDSE